MSLASLALRISVVQALMGRTLVGDRVFDSRIDPLDKAIEQEQAPLIAVYTEDEEFIPHQGARLDLGARSLDLVIHLVVRTRVTMTPDGVPEDAYDIPETDAGLEILLDILRRQVFRVLQAGQGEFADVARMFIVKVDRVQIRRMASAETGLRFAAREIVIKCDTLSDPDAADAAPEHAYARFIAACRAMNMDGFTAIADAIEAECAAAPASPQSLAAVAAAWGAPQETAALLRADTAPGPAELTPAIVMDFSTRNGLS